jgi:hypothetical protein
LAACPTLDHAHHAGAPQGIGHTHHHHHDGSGSHRGNCLNCCMGTCLLGASLPPPSTSASLLAFYGTPVVYASEQSVLSDRSIRPTPDLLNRSPEPNLARNAARGDSTRPGAP